MALGVLILQLLFLVYQLLIKYKNANRGGKDDDSIGVIGGFAMKERIVELLKGINIQVIDQGCYSDESVSYPMFAHKVTNDIQNQKADFGVLICKTGVGMSIAANKQKGIRAALVSDKEVAMLARKPQ